MVMNKFSVAMMPVIKFNSDKTKLKIFISEIKITSLYLLHFLFVHKGKCPRFGPVWETASYRKHEPSPDVGKVKCLEGHPKNLAWNGGPLHMQCDHGPDLWLRSGLHVTENVIATKALSFNDEIYVITPRMKHGILASLWLIVREKHTVELQPYPELRSHNLGDCSAIQNAMDFYLDHLGNLWILDTGIVDSLSSPRCTCPPKVVEVNLLLGKVVKSIDISPLTEPSSLLQNIVVEYTLAKIYIYVSDATRGSVVVHEATSASTWTVLACAPAVGLQIALVKRLAYSALVIVRLHYQGLLEIDTTALKRKNSNTFPIKVFGEHTKPVTLLGADAHHVYLRHVGCADVLSWDSRDPYNASRLENIHSSGPRLSPTSVAADPLKHVLLVLDSNYADTIHTNMPTYHKITFV